jgi:beta-fructofuranosidase
MLDPAFPSLHIRPGYGWMNDPNGLCRIDGHYHVFYQYNALAPRHEAITWGHSTSTDLIHWDHLGVALVNRPGQVDQIGCWSGGIVDDDGVPTAVYTAVPDQAWNAGVVLARSDRTLRHWVQDEEMVMGTPDDQGIDEVRDPFVFTFEGHRYVIQGAGQRTGRPQIRLYGCDDLSDWVELGPLLRENDPVAAAVAPANIWECPNLIQVDGRWVLLVSLWRWENGTHQLAGVRYLLGTLRMKKGGPRFQAQSGGVLDSGPTFYAPQALSELDRTLLWGWAREDGRSDATIAEAGWAGVLTFPRELYLSGDELGTRPAAELSGLRTRELDWEVERPFTARSFEVVATGAVTLVALRGEQERIVAAVSTHDRATRILVDASMVEVFAGLTAHTSRHYPAVSDRWMLRADPTTTTVYALGY